MLPKRKKKKHLLKLGSYVKDRFYKQTKPVHPHNTYTPQLVLASNCYCLKLCELASSLSLYIIASHVISTSFFSFKFTDSAFSHSVSWKYLCLKSLQDLQVKFVFIGSCFWCLDHHVLASAATKLLAALQLFALWVESEFKSGIITSPDQFGTHSPP
jgi:hypothetical protein